MDYHDESKTQSNIPPIEQPIEVNSFSIEDEPKVGKPRKRTHKNRKWVALCLSCALIGGVVGSGINYLSHGGRTTSIYTGNRTPVTLTTVGVDTHKELTNSEIYSNYVNSTVGITVDIVTTNIFGQTVKGAAAGSGFVITEDGYILTNYHVIEDANSITVTFVDGKSYPARLIGGEQGNDIAVIKIDATGLKPVVMGNSDEMRVGEQVSAIGNPLGELTFSLTSGVVSALNRTITMSDGTPMNMIQTDCAINSGNSGGPLFNTYGEVIGIVSAKYSSGSMSNGGGASVEGLGFAIPVNDVADMISDLIANGYVTGKPFLGVSVQTVDSAAQRYGIPAGAQIIAATPGLCADKAGLKEGDIITALDKTPVTSNAELVNAKNAYKAGDTVQFTVYRDGKTLKISLTFDEENTKNIQKHEEYAKTKEEELKKQAQQQQQQQQQQQEQYSQQPQQGTNPWNYFFPFGY